MNKKEINEIKKNLTEDCSYMSIKNILTTYVNGEKEIQYQNTHFFSVIEQETAELILMRFRKILSGNMGKSLLEYNFPIEFSDTNCKQIFIDTLSDGFKDEEKVNNYINHIIDNMDYAGNYVIFSLNATYTVRSKYSDDTDNEDDTYDYNFIMTCICPVELRFQGLICTDEPKIEKEIDIARVVGLPVDGWIYPTFSERQPDLNTILYSTKSSKSANSSIVENVFGCNFYNNADEQKDLFNEILTSSLGESLTYQDICDINDTIINKLEEHRFETEPMEFKSSDIVDIVKSTGYTDEQVNYVSKICDSKLEDGETLNAEAIVNSKNIMTTGSFKITYSNNDINKVKIDTVNGKKIISIEIDDNVELNGIPIIK
jgi:hypothetical protein